MEEVKKSTYNKEYYQKNKDKFYKHNLKYLNKNTQELHDLREYK